MSLIRDRSQCDWPDKFANQDFARFGMEIIDRLPLNTKYWFSSVGLMWLYRPLCEKNIFDTDKAVRLNQWIWIFVVFLCALMSRLLGQSWLLCLVVVTTLMSRGHFISKNALVSSDVGAAALFTLICCLFLLFVRTSSWWAFGLYFTAIAGSVLFEKSLVLLAFLPVIVSVVTRLARPIQIESHAPQRYGSFVQLFRDRLSSWSSWNNSQRNWIKIVWWGSILGASLIAPVLFYAMLAYEKSFGDLNVGLLFERFIIAMASEPLSYRSVMANLDVHYALSLLLVTGCALRGSLNKNLVWGCRVFIVAAFTVIGTSVILDGLDLLFYHFAFSEEQRAQLFITPSIRESVYWSEPFLISLGVGVAWQLIAQDLRFIFRADK